MTRPIVEISKEFRFEAAHFLPYAGDDSPNRRMHGHSFRAVITLRGAPDPETGLLKHFGELSDALEGVRKELDHRLLNDVDGLGFPTLELIAIWIWDRLIDDFDALATVAVHRDSCGESCIFRGEEEYEEGEA